MTFVTVLIVLSLVIALVVIFQRVSKRKCVNTTTSSVVWDSPTYDANRKHISSEFCMELKLCMDVYMLLLS